MQTLLELLRFERFIAADVLIVFYYLGAIFIPIFLYLFHRYIREHIPLVRKVEALLHSIFLTFDTHKKVYLFLLFLFGIIVTELMWRMMFEIMIGYFHMHDYLKQIAET